MQYVKDTHSKHAALFLYLRSLILSFPEIHEVKNAKQTTYKDTLSTVCMMRVRHDRVHLSFANGTKMMEKFPQLQGEAKIVRYLEFTTKEEVDMTPIRAMIAESLLLNIEKDALKQLKTHS